MPPVLHVAFDELPAYIGRMADNPGGFLKVVAIL
jgi:hypothetical protein